MATANAVRRKQIEDLTAAWKRMMSVEKAAKELKEELARKKEEEEAD